MPVQPRVKAVLFDLGNVVCSFEPQRRLEALAKESNLPATLVSKLLWGSGFVSRADYTAEEEFAFVRDALALSCSYEIYRGIWAQAFVPNAQVLKLVELVRTQDITVLLSDNGPVLSDALQHELALVARPFDRIFLSWSFGATKPDSRLLTAVEEQLKLSPSELLLVDDSSSIIAGVLKRGWVGQRFDSAERLEQELRARSLLGKRD